jgi:peptidoglycan/xylan/chitin deacetylase (PgdA/CDA1 family)
MRSCRDTLPPAVAPLTWVQVRELAAYGVEIGCHTVTHPILASLSLERQREEIAGAKERIAQTVGKVPTLFAYPNGADSDFDDVTIGVLDDNGFEAACTTARGPNRPGDDPFRLKRISVGSDSPALLSARLCGMLDDNVRALLPESWQHTH